MSNPDELQPAQNSYPIRFGILDLVAALVLFGVHLHYAKSVIFEGYSRNTERWLAAAAICAAFAFGSAYLAFRYATTHKISSRLLRVAHMVAIDVCLLAPVYLLTLTV